MHIDARTLDDHGSLEADLCVIGAGPAGITIARELRNSRHTVLLLESGGLDLDPATQALYEAQSVGLPYTWPLNAARLRYFGGTSGHWSGWCAPLDSMDFEKRDWIAYSGWPMTFRDLEPWYRRAQEICQLGPFEYEAEYWERRSGLRRLPLSPAKISSKVIEFSPPTRFGTEYREEIVRSSNIKLCTFANATDIQSNDSGSHVTGVEVTTLGGKKTAVRAKSYVLACGGLENPRILLLSNRKIRPGLGNHNDLVGRFFTEHPHIDTSRMLLPDEHGAPFYKYVSRSSGNRPPFIGLFGIPPDLQRAHRISNYSSIIVSAIEKQAGGTVWQLNTRLEQMPNPQSRVTLDASRRDALGQLQLRLEWRMTALDKRSIRVAETLIANELGRTGVGRMQMPDWLVAEDDVWPSQLSVGPHHMGTTRMSASAKSGVVDAHCKVHGIDNLYVAGSSVFATAGTANPTLTIVALAARLASRLKESALR
jgi:choline dehydrogenase-like flavoprotein